MSIYTNIINAHYPSLEGALKPQLCPSCRCGGCSNCGECAHCLRAYADNKEYLETHTFITDDCLGGYHTDAHDDIKCLPLRLPHEKPTLYYGIELEIGFDYDCVEVGDYDNDTLDAILEEFTRITNGLFVYEEDSTIQNGAEFISRPCSYAYWTHPDTITMLKNALEYLRDEGALVNQPDGHGMHVHISQKFFNNSTQHPAESIRNFDWLFQKFQPEIEKLAGRPYRDYCQSKIGMAQCNLRTGYDGVQATHFVLRKDNTSTPSDNHSYAVILSGPTVEARVFKSTIDYKTVLANIELVRNFAHASRHDIAELTLDNILHTKDNKFLDEHIQHVKMKNKANYKLNLEKENTDEIEFTINNN